MDRRQRLYGVRVRQYHRRMTRPTAAVFMLATLGAAAAAADIPLAERKSGYDFMARETRAMQDDDTVNPATFWVLDGETVWRRKQGSAGETCADCHGGARTGMQGGPAAYPACNAARGRPVDLEQRINTCRTEQQRATPLAFEGKELLALTAYIGEQSRGMPIDIADDARVRPFLEAGRAMFTERQGQLNLSCGQCHDDNGAQSSPAPRSRKAIRPDIRSIGSSGKCSDRCSDGCAIACSACARSLILTARVSLSISNSI